MFEKNLEVGLLLDFYGDILPERRREMIELYYNDDLSLAEVAEQLGVTRQAVRETVKKTETELYFYEEKLGLLRRKRRPVPVASVPSVRRRRTASRRRCARRSTGCVMPSVPGNAAFQVTPHPVHGCPGKGGAVPYGDVFKSQREAGECVQKIPQPR